MSAKLDGKIPLVTGGNSGIGLATAKRFAREGAFVFITGRRKNELEKAAKLIGPEPAAIRADVSNTRRDLSGYWRDRSPSRHCKSSLGDGRFRRLQWTHRR